MRAAATTAALSYHQSYISTSSGAPQSDKRMLSPLVKSEELELIDRARIGSFLICCSTCIATGDWLMEPCAFFVFRGLVPAAPHSSLSQARSIGAGVA